MSDLAPVYTSPHSFAVMEPLSVSSTHAQMVPLSQLGTNFVNGNQLLQASGGHIVQVAQQQPQVQNQQTVDKQRSQPQPHQQLQQGQVQQLHLHHQQPHQIAAIGQPLQTTPDGVTGFTVIKLEAPQQAAVQQEVAVNGQVKTKKKKKKKEPGQPPATPDGATQVAGQELSWNCELCGKMFQNRFNLKRHRLGVHGGVDMSFRITCDLCHKDFHYSDNLRRHKKNVHGIGGPVDVKVQPVGEEEQMEIEHKLITHEQELQQLQQQQPQQPQQPQQQTQLQPQPIKADATQQPDQNQAVALVTTDQPQKSYECEICNKNLQSKYNLKRHKVRLKVSHISIFDQIH
jgi:hypothetical protein